jgi:sugar O-acyltransferase (sialic acid O-acetyltransferase NeuD family)
MKKIKIAIYGAGGFGRELAWLIRESDQLKKQYEHMGFIDDNPDRIQYVNKSQLFTLEQATQAFPDAQVLIAVGNPNAREQLAKKVLEAGFTSGTFVHPSVIRSSSIDLGVGSIVCAGCVLTTDIVLGKHAVVLFNSTIGHNGIIGDYSIIGPGVCMAGTVIIGKRVFIGAGTVIINGSLTEPILIGDDSMVGAGSCVIRSFPPGSHIFGNPARPIPK